jgi:hypothetical protein
MKASRLFLVKISLLASMALLIILWSGQSFGQEWEKTYGEGGLESGNSVQQTTDGGYIIVADTTSFGNQGYYPDVYEIKTDATGDMLWMRRFGGTGNDSGRSVQQTTDGGYIIAGSDDG